MPGILKIYCGAMKGADGAEPLDFDIVDLLALAGDAGAKWKWALSPAGEYTYLLGGAIPTLGLTADEISREINAEGVGVPLSWTRLLAVAEAIDQTIDGIYIACLSKNSFVRLKELYTGDWRHLDTAKEEYYQLVEAAFQAVDSSWWLVYAKDDALLERIASVFHSVQALRTW